MSQTRIPSKSTTTTGDREVENLIKQIIATHLQQMKISLEIEDLLDDGPISRATIIHDFAERLNYTFTKQKLLYNFIIYNQGCSLLCTMGPPYELSIKPETGAYSQNYEFCPARVQVHSSGTATLAAFRNGETYQRTPLFTISGWHTNSTQFRDKSDTSRFPWGNRSAEFGFFNKAYLPEGMRRTPLSVEGTTEGALPGEMARGFISEFQTMRVRND